MKNPIGSVVLYTCKPNIILLCSKPGKLFVIDTRAVPSSAGGKDTAIVKFLEDGEKQSGTQSAGSWPWKELKALELQSRVHNHWLL